MSGRFRYGLAPLLLTRQWDLDALLVELGEHNAALARQEQDLAALRARAGALVADWNGMTGGGKALSVERFARTTQFLSDLSRRTRDGQAELENMARARDELATRVVAAQRALEAVEEHRDEMKSKFIQLRLSGDFKIADDQWNTLQAGK